ncbi:MAG: hypothetical protein KDB82_09425 [Planctomycetes bacterium]|nr:hypothetical protein [Planctomycetota bacterium]
MKTAILFLALALLLAACGGGNAEAEKNAELHKRAEVAERNLVKVRDAIVAYYKKNKKAPETMDDLADFGAAEKDLEVNDDYSELAYTFLPQSLEFDDSGKLTRCWLIATPISKTGALQVRMNGVTGNFDYVAADEDFGPAPDDEGWGNEPANAPANEAANQPAGNG